MEKRLNLSRLPSLDGWRFISIAMVLVAHSRDLVGCPGWLGWAAVNLFDSGSLGVRFFFVISGFLITWLLLLESDQAGRVSLKHFYMRRSLRIFPVYFAFLTVLGLIHWLTPYQQSQAAWIGNFTFTTNFIKLRELGITGHLWSLAVEEQFYLIWPGVFLICGVALNFRTAVRVLSVPILTAPVFRMIACKHWYPASLSPLFNFYPTFNFYDSLAVGCVCAIVLARKRAWLKSTLEKHRLLVALGGVGLICIPPLLTWAHTPARVLAAVGDSAQAAGFALLLLQSILTPKLGWYPFLNWSWVCHIGVLSYSIYIWQQMFCYPTTLGLNPSRWWVSFPGWIFMALLAAHVSYYCLERPLFRMRARFRDATNSAVETSNK